MDSKLKEALDDENIWFIVENDIYSVSHMNEDEILESILDDCLVMHFNFNFKPNIDQLLRFLKTSEQKRRVYKILMGEAQKWIDVDPKTLIISLHTNKLQKIQDIAGWFNGYKIPPGIETFQLSDSAQQQINELGIDGFVDKLIKEHGDEFLTILNDHEDETRH